MNCKHYKKDNPKESRCVMDSSVGMCIVEKGLDCKKNECPERYNAN